MKRNRRENQESQKSYAQSTNKIDKTGSTDQEKSYK